MKQFLSIFTILLVAFFAFACGGEGDKTASEDMAKKPQMTAASGGYMATAVTDGGSITGTVTFAGAIPPKVKIEKTKDTAVCGQKTHYKEDLLVSANKGLANVVVSLTNITQGKSMDSMGSEFVLDQNGCVFVPHVTVIPVGAELSVVNSDGILHNIHTFSETNSPINVAQPKFKKKITHSFSEAEIFPIKCDVHNWMNGYIAVAAHPYYAKTDESGKFELRDVPAGTYTVEYWHEKLGKQTMEVTVTGGASADASFEYAAMGS